MPRGISAPGAELALRVHDLAPSPDTLVIVNCAGRTRSIIGAQSLVNAGIPNRVAALRNGTIGWTLVGFSLDRGRRETFGPLTEGGLAKARANAKAWADKVGVPEIDKATLDCYRAEAGKRSLYCFDVRAPEEFLAGRPAGFVSAPGGQLVQATDEWVAVRGVRIVLFDDDGVRARMTASWLVQMGWDATVVEDERVAHDESGGQAARRTAPRDVGGAALPPAEAAKLGGAFVDLSPSPVYRKGHAPGAWFVSGSRLGEDLKAIPGDGPLVLFSSDGALAADNLGDVRAATKRPVYVIAGGLAAWAVEGLPIETKSFAWASQPNDVYKRPYEGTDNARAAMQAYIDWEPQFVAQLANDGVSNFHVIR